MNYFDIPNVVHDPETPDYDREYNDKAVVSTVDLWVPRYPDNFPEQVQKTKKWGKLKAQEESLEGLVFDSEKACLDAMEKYISALDDYNRYVLFNYFPNAYDRFTRQGDWAETEERIKIGKAFEEKLAEEKGLNHYELDDYLEEKEYYRVTELIVDRHEDHILLTSRWEEKFPGSNGWRPVQWLRGPFAMGEHFEPYITDQRTFKHTARKLNLHYG